MDAILSVAVLCSQSATCRLAASAVALQEEEEEEVEEEEEEEEVGGWRQRSGGSGCKACAVRWRSSCIRGGSPRTCIIYILILGFKIFSNGHRRVGPKPTTACRCACAMLLFLCRFYAAVWGVVRNSSLSDHDVELRCEITGHHIIRNRFLVRCQYCY
jgi:hypothetical protein